jgi:hypothetical protein
MIIAAVAGMRAAKLRRLAEADVAIGCEFDVDVDLGSHRGAGLRLLGTVSQKFSPARHRLYRLAPPVCV